MEIGKPDVDHAIAFHSSPGHGQDRWVIQDVFKGRRGGYFVEAGASEIGENTYTLESQFGWTGLAVEPVPESFEVLKNTRRCNMENACLSNVESEVEFVINKTIPGLSRMRGASDSDASKNDFREETLRIKAYPLVDLLRKHGAPKRIDYLSLDVEGDEWLVLKDFPFDEYSFSCMTIERGSKDYLRLRAKLLAEGYRLVRSVRPDDFWVHPSMDYRAPLSDLLITWIRRIHDPMKERLKTAFYGP
jgi:FkbM family methyltransferase